MSPTRFVVCSAPAMPGAARRRGACPQTIPSIRRKSRFEHEVWSRCAPSHVDTFGAPTTGAIPPLLDAMRVAHGSRVLDVGTGPGLVAAAAVARGAEVTGVDFSEAMLAEARHRYSAIAFRQASADELPFEDGTFDAVVSNLVVRHLGRPERAAREACWVLRPGGRLAFTVWGDPAKLEAFGLFFAAVATHMGAAELPHGPLFGVSDFAVFDRLVRAARFRDATVEEVPIAWRTTSADTLLAGFGDWAQMEAWPEAGRVAVEADVRAAARAYEADGVLTMPNPVILVAAIK
jgi:SAM-dependent methyltransferase